MAIVGEKQMLFSLNGVDFAANYGKLEKAHKFYLGGVQTLAYWSETKGGGRFTKLISTYFVSQLKRWMKEGAAFLKYTESYNPQYQKYKEKYNVLPWLLHKNVYKNIGIIYRGKHTQTVGIRRNIMVPRIGINGKQYGNISVAKYAMINEFGGKLHPARPLFMPAMLRFVSEKFPPMANMVKKAIYDAAKNESKDMTTKAFGKGQASNVISAASLKGMHKVVGSGVEKDFSTETFTEKLSRFEASKAQINVPAYVTPAGARMVKKSDAVMQNWLKKEGWTTKDLDTNFE